MHSILPLLFSFWVTLIAIGVVTSPFSNELPSHHLTSWRRKRNDCQKNSRSDGKIKVTHPTDRRSVTSRTNLPTICSLSSEPAPSCRLHLESVDLRFDGEPGVGYDLRSMTRTAIEPTSGDSGLPQL